MFKMINFMIHIFLTTILKIGKNKERFRVLNDPSVDVAVLREFTDAPDILFFADIDDPGNGNYWINLKMAEYYNKKEIILERK